MFQFANSVVSHFYSWSFTFFMEVMGDVKDVNVDQMLPYRLVKSSSWSKFCRKIVGLLLAINTLVTKQLGHSIVGRGTGMYRQPFSETYPSTHNGTGACRGRKIYTYRYR
jgi:hypothetical protein